MSQFKPAAAARTKRIRLMSAVTVLSTSDPVRVFQQFATLDIISKERAEIIAGRGSATEAFPLFGYNLNDYDAFHIPNGHCGPDKPAVNAVYRVDRQPSHPTGQSEYRKAFSI